MLLSGVEVNMPNDESAGMGSVPAWGSLLPAHPFVGSPVQAGQKICTWKTWEM